MIKTGTSNKKSLTVTEAETALCMGSGTLSVFATPAMIALMEATASESIEDQLEPGTTSVGTMIAVKHLSADPVGEKVVCESLLTETDGRRCVFRLTVYDSEGTVGEGTHERYIVRCENFMKKATAKLKNVSGKE